MGIKLSLNHLVNATKYIPVAIKTASCISYQMSRFFDSLRNDTTPSKHSFNATSPSSNTGKKVDFACKDQFEQNQTSKTVQNITYNPHVSTRIPTIQNTVPWCGNFRNVSVHRDLLEDPFNADLEHLVKYRIKHPLYQGQKIEMRTLEGSFASYTVHRKIAGQGLVSYALKPASENANLSPLIVFRGTETNPLKENSFESMQNDVDIHIGEKGWMSARKSFEELMQDPTFRNAGEKIKVAGYSLGGAHAQYFVSEYHREVSHGIFYNDPSIQGQITEKFAGEIEESHRDEPLILQIFRTQGDPFHHFGDKHLGCNVDHPNVSTQLLEISVPNQYHFDTALHSKRIFDTEQFDYTVREFTDPSQLSRKLDNAKRDPVTSLLETLRQKLSCFLSSALAAIKSFFSWIF
jgi:hypothetical protein